MVDLTVRAGAVADDVVHVCEFGLASQRAGVGGQRFDEGTREFVDIDPSLAGGVAQESHAAVPLGEPAVLLDQFRRRFRRQPACPVHARQIAHERGVQRHHGHGVVDGLADVANAQLQRGKGPGRPDVPPELAAVLYERHAAVAFHQFVVFGPRVQGTGQARAGQTAEEGQPVRLEAGFAPAAERRRGRERVEQGHVPAHGRHDAHAAVGVAEPRVDVHAADEQFPDGLLVGHGELFVTLFGRGDLLVPGREGVGGRGHDRGAVFRRGVDDHAPGLDQGGPDVGNRRADPRGGLDLGPQELGDDLVLAAMLLTFLEDPRVRIRQQVARFGVDEEELLLDAQGDGEGICGGCFFHRASRSGFREIL